MVSTGDSFTEGLHDGGDDAPVGWADRLALHLDRRRGGAPPLEYANLAIRGRLLGQIIDEQLPQALELAPDLVTLCGGGNDLLRPGADPDALAERVEGAVALLRSRGIDVLL
ncbi:MAG: SGNH/GDSL hydrolase family protein, partial [Actinomycetes bacterium]|nr:SGNH/GDSL hydrolase family protein [Actinomycetes bacterium]